MRVRRCRQHADVGAGTENVVLAGFQDHRADFRMFEAEPLDAIVEFDVDAEVIGIQFEFVARPQPAGFVDIHDDAGDIAVDFDTPVAVTIRMGPKIDDISHDERRFLF